MPDGRAKDGWRIYCNTCYDETFDKERDTYIPSHEEIKAAWWFEYSLASNGIKDRLKALEMLCRCLHLFDPAAVKVSDAQLEQYRTMSFDDLRRLALASLASPELLGSLAAVPEKPEPSK